MTKEATPNPVALPTIQPALTLRRRRLDGAIHRLRAAAFAAALTGGGLVAASLLVGAPDWLRAAGLGLGSTLTGLAVGCVLASRGRWRRAVTSALAAYAAGERRADALRIDDGLGELSQAWNHLVSAREDERVSAVISEAEHAALGRDRRRSAGGGAFDALWHGVLLLDAQGMIVEANGAAAVMLGAIRDQMIGAPLSTLRDAGPLTESAASVIAGATARASALLSRTTDGQQSHFRATTRRVRRDDSATAMMVIEDVTQQHAAESARAAFVAQATHELRNPLTSIRLYVEEAIDAGESDAEVRARALQVIQHESRRLERVIADMLSASEIEAGTLSLRSSTVELEPIFAELRADFSPQALSKQIDLSFDLPPKYPRATADRDKLVLAIHNVIGNAIKYTPAGGKVAVRVDATDAELTVEVSDTGIGIAPADQPKVFDRFYRANDERVAGETGSGLGLALSREVVRLHGGEITLASELNKGSTFSLRIPIGRGADAARAA